MPPLGPVLSTAPSTITLEVLVLLGGILTAIVAGVALATVVRRRERAYGLIALAFLALFARTVVAAIGNRDLITPVTHHHIEHGLDIAMAALVIGAVYYARTVEQHVTHRPTGEETDD